MMFFSELLAYVYMLSRINWLRAIQLCKKDAEVVVWVKWPIVRLIRPDIGVVYDLIYIKYLIHNNISFSIVFDKNIGKVKNRRILINLSRSFNSKEFDDWGQVIANDISLLEKQGNTLGPSFWEATYWEDKISMHELFNKHEVICPKTIVCRSRLDLEAAKDMTFPVISKIPHGAGSMGIEEFTSFAQLDSADLKFPVLIQERLPMSMDARIVVIDGKIIDYYFRVNTSKKWHPTSTSKGSVLKYFDIPVNLQKYLISLTKELNLRVGAYDVAWIGDDLNRNDFKILEVSPAYLPNPKYHGSIPYKDWKRRFWLKNPFWKALILTLEEHRFKQIEAYLK
jgi:hypothetical protein